MELAETSSIGTSVELSHWPWPFQDVFFGSATAPDLSTSLPRVPRARQSRTVEGLPVPGWGDGGSTTGAWSTTGVETSKRKALVQP